MDFRLRQDLCVMLIPVGTNQLLRTSIPLYWFPMTKYESYSRPIKQFTNQRPDNQDLDSISHSTTIEHET